MYIGYLFDRIDQNFNCSQDLLAANQLVNLSQNAKENTGILVLYTIKKTKKIFFIVFSKETLVNLVSLVIVVTAVYLTVEVIRYDQNFDKFTTGREINLEKFIEKTFKLYIIYSR
jgi:hypothetical protein